MLTSIQSHDEVLASMAAGADAYCMKEIKLDRLAQVIEMVMDGAIWLDPNIARMVMQILPEKSDSTKTETNTSFSSNPSKIRYNTELTEREIEVMRLIVDGKSNKEIAQILKITGHTVKAHVGNIIQKLAVDDRTQVAVKALREGLI